MNKLFVGLLIIVVVLVGGFFSLNSFIYKEKQVYISKDYKDTEYIVEGERITLGETFSYFGNELIVDLNEDGRNDIVFLITNQPGGSGIFYYVVAALNTSSGYLGSNGYFLGDRIAPQTTELSKDLGEKNIIIVNYADRDLREPMTTQPSIGKSVYLKLDTKYLQWNIIVPNSEE